MHVYINSKCLIVDHYKVKCVVGKRGIGKKLKEGDKITPKGKFKVKYILYRKDRISSISTKIPNIKLLPGLKLGNSRISNIIEYIKE